VQCGTCIALFSSRGLWGRHQAYVALAGVARTLGTAGLAGDASFVAGIGIAAAFEGDATGAAALRCMVGDEPWPAEPECCAAAFCAAAAAAGDAWMGFFSTARTLLLPGVTLCTDDGTAALFSGAALCSGAAVCSGVTDAAVCSAIVECEGDVALRAGDVVVCSDATACVGSAVLCAGVALCSVATACEGDAEVLCEGDSVVLCECAASIA
jgi:hypothetical protein